MSASIGDWLPHLRQLFAVALVTSLPLVGLAKARRLKRFTSSIGRLSLYRTTLLWTFAVASLSVVLTLPGNVMLLERSVPDAPWLLGSYGKIAATLMVGTLVALFLGQTLYIGSTPKLRTQYARAIRDFRYFLPVTQVERRWFLLICLNAGLSEEIICRGYLLQFLSGRITGGISLGLTAALLVSSLAFGLGHLYQGAKRVVLTGTCGALLGVIAILTGSLILPIIVHALIDASALWIYRPQLDDPIAAERLTRGYDLTADA